MLYRVLDTNGGLRGEGGITNGLLYRVADTKGGLSGEVVLLRIYNTSCHGYQGCSKGKGYC